MNAPEAAPAAEPAPCPCCSRTLQLLDRTIAASDLLRLEIEASTEDLRRRNERLRRMRSGARA